MVKVLIVDDSAVARDILKKGLSVIPDIAVVGTAEGAYVARDKIVELEPDVMTLDIEMPKMNGIDFLTKLMPQYPLPVIIVSSMAESNAAATLRAMEAGAVDYVLKPSVHFNFKLADMIVELGEKIKIAAKIDVSEWKNKRIEKTSNKVYSNTIKLNKNIVIVIGASTGGTDALRKVITALPASIPGIVVVQHMPPVFTKLFADKLNEIARVTVKEAQDGDPVLPGQVLIAPGGIHTVLSGKPGTYKVLLRNSDKVNGHKPSVDVLFHSAAVHCCPNALGVVLTGMGHDGAKGLLEMRQAGARTFAQDEASSVVFGMPKEAFINGGAEKLIPLDRSVDVIMKMLVEIV